MALDVRTSHQSPWHSHSSSPPPTAVLSIIGNLLVIIMAVRKSSKMKPPELLCVNLAVTDLGASVTMYPLAMAAAWSHHWIGGDATCVLYGLAGFFFGVASIMNLTLLAVVRFIVSLNLQSPSKKIQSLKFPQKKMNYVRIQVFINRPSAVAKCRIFIQPQRQE